MRVGGTGSKAQIPMAGSLTVLQGYTQPVRMVERRQRRSLILLLTLAPQIGPHFHLEMPLPKRNYGFEKRQKELAKKRKREEKRQRRTERDAPDDPTPADQDADPDYPDTPAAQP